MGAKFTNCPTGHPSEISETLLVCNFQLVVIEIGLILHFQESGVVIESWKFGDTL
jgi:hypothetical protein